MGPGVGSAGPSEVVLKSRNSSGCLIVRKKGDALPVGVGSSSSQKLYDKKLAKRHSVASSDSGSSDESLMPPSRRMDPETVRIGNGLTAYQQGMVAGSELGRKRDILSLARFNKDLLVNKNGFEEREIKRNKLDAFDSDEYEGVHVEKSRRHFDGHGVGFGGGRYMGSMHAGRSGIEKEFDPGSSRSVLGKRNNSHYDRTGGLYMGNDLDRSRFKMDRDGPQLPLPLLREKFAGNGDEFIRIQGKNGVLKVRVGKKKVGGTLDHYDHRKHVESQQILRTEGATAKRNDLTHSSLNLETALVAEKSGLVPRPDKKKIASRKSLSSKDSKGDALDSENSDTSSNLGRKNTKARKSMKRISSEDEQASLHEKVLTTRTKEGKARGGSGTEKQKLREKIREMLLSAGWTIDYRPRRNRDYLDAVYINPAGTAYWSIIKAYDALQKQLADVEKEVKPNGDGSSFALFSDEVLSQLTRKTRKKMEKELKKKQQQQQRDCSESDSEREPHTKRFAGNKHASHSFDCDSNEEKLNSSVKQGNKSMKNKMAENAISGASSKSPSPDNEGSEKQHSGCDPRLL
ncbi:hypothetical protein QN277_027284 [Acacia crassicarpa]|uniref:DUF7028 domain-containing protein n=1 Tax=Acacia crassicarpa TaxID=499986 RepID=A0AAE1K5S9_9FABA|nr:hypothetical protein QN277_027284 [Acacia crassicarpa]